jgi:hypothetical protein
VSRDRQKLNATFTEKAALRRKALTLLADRGIRQPAVLEAYGGEGKLWAKVYPHLRRGVVFEQDIQRARLLARQRPTWSVYEGDCVPAIAEGAGKHLKIDLLDADPFGSPHEAIEAFLGSERPHADVLGIVVNDGLRLNIRHGVAFRTGVLKPIVERYGNSLFDQYPDVCQVMMHERAQRYGYRMTEWICYLAGRQSDLTHYLAIFER